MTISKAGHSIGTLDEWFRHAPPKRPDQWANDRSAKESARCWLSVTSPALPVEIEGLLASHPAFATVMQWTAEPEVRLPFDTYRGEPRNSDLVVKARDSHGDYLIAVEAKADETFSDTVAETLRAARTRKAGNPRSNGEARIEGLLAAVLGVTDLSDAAAMGLRYQLLTATAGALRAGQNQGVDRVVLLVHEFRTRRTTDAKHDANASDLNAFVARLSGGDVTAVSGGHLAGPFAVPGVPLLTGPVPALFIGKAVRSLRDNAA